MELGASFFINRCHITKEKIKMNCSDIKSNLVFMAERSLPADRLAEVEIHLESCPSCQLLAGRFVEVYSSLDKMDNEISPFFATKVYSRLEEGSFVESWMPYDILRSVRPVAAVLLILTLTTFGLFFTKGKFTVLNKPVTPAVATSLPADYYISTGPGEDTMEELIVSNEK